MHEILMPFLLSFSMSLLNLETLNSSLSLFTEIPLSLFGVFGMEIQIILTVFKEMLSSLLLLPVCIEMFSSLRHKVGPKLSTEIEW